MKQTVVVIVLLGILCGCANWDAFQAQQTSRYVGQSVDTLYDEYGVPVGIAPKRNGGKFFEFQHYRGEFLCTAKVTTDARMIVTKIDVGGQNGCVM